MTRQNEIPTERAAAVEPPPLLTTWSRRRTPSAEPNARPGQVAPDDLACRLAVTRELIEAARPHLEWLSAHHSAFRHVVHLTDRDGIVLAAFGDEALQHTFALTPGHDWSETAMGTNGAGTALATGMPVAVVGPEHSVRAFEDCTCVAAPIRAASGDIVGAVDLRCAVADGNVERTSLIAYVALMIGRDLVDSSVRSDRSSAKRLADELALRTGQLEQAHEQLRLILDNAPVLIYLVDESGRFLNANKAWVTLAGIREPSVIGRSLYDVFPDEEARQFEVNNRRVLEQGSAVALEEAHAGRTYLSVKVPVRDTAGRAYAICGMSVDISERKRAEQMLRESEDRFRAMADSLPLIVWLHDEHGEQQFVNQTFCEFFGVTRDEMRRNRWQALTHPDSGVAYAAAFLECVRNRQPFHGEVQVRRADGEWRWIESWATPRFSVAGEFLGVVGASADITERKATAQRLEASEASLREADRKKNEALTTLGHELRNPLAAIRNAMHILRSPGVTPSDEEVARGIVERQVGYLLRLADDLLDVGRITLGRVAVHRELIDLRDVAADAAVAGETSMRNAGHRFRYDPPVQPVRVSGDRARLAQVVSNLLGNAARYTPPGGAVELTVSSSDDTAIITVEDDGIGLEPQDLDLIFEPFRQAERGDGVARGGLGIGLTLVRQLVELHDGTVSASSAGKGRGSRFEVRLPLATPANEVKTR